MHGIIKSRLKACKEKYDKKLDPEKREEEVQLRENGEKWGSSLYFYELGIKLKLCCA